MTKFSIALLAMAAALAITPAALAGAYTLCASAASTGGNGNGATGVSAGALSNATCGSENAVTISLSDNSGNELIKWHSSIPGFPTSLTVGNLGSLNAPVLFTSGEAGDQPYYDLAFYTTDNSLGAGTSGDLITMLENQPVNISGGSLSMNAGTTLFDIYDWTQSNNTGQNVYLAGGQSDTNSLAEWVALYPSIGSDAFYAIDIGIGSATYTGTGSPDGMTVNSLDITETPEPSSLLLLGTGLLGLAFVVFRKAKPSGMVLHS
jgi:hypothetical protein